MKKLFYLCLCALMTCFVACKDDNNDNAQPVPQPNEENDQYLIMLYGAGGGSLDYDIAKNILQALEVGSSDKVKMTFQYRFSKSYQQMEDERFANLKNVRRFDADENTHLKGAYNATDITLDDTALVYNYYRSINSTSIGDTAYVMASDTALTSFIKWSKAKHPNASKTILIISDHGNGWNLYSDGHKDMTHDQTTRAILADDNTFDKQTNKSKCLSVGDVKRALSEAGGIDVLYTDACLMSTWENLAGYSSVAKYFIGSLETAPGLGGNYHYFVNRLADSQVTDEGMESALRGYVDDIVDKWWDDTNIRYEINGDMNLYNLKKIDAPLSLIRQITQTLTEKWESTTPIEGIPPYSELGDEWKNYIRPAITECIAATRYFSEYVLASAVPEPLKDYLAQVEAKIYVIDGKECYNPYSVLYVLRESNMEEYDPDGQYMEEYRKLWSIIQKETTDSYCFADFLRNIVLNLRFSGLDDANNPFVTYQKQYIDAVKAMGYIRSTHPLPAEAIAEYGMIDYDYNCCSPGIFIYSFDKAVYEKSPDFTYRWAELIPDVDVAFESYKSCDFDKKTSWSNFLRKIDVIPSIISNHIRKDYRY